MSLEKTMQHWCRKDQIHHHLIENVNTHTKTLYLNDNITELARHGHLTQNNKQADTYGICTQTLAKNQHAIRNRNTHTDQHKQYQNSHRQKDKRPADTGRFFHVSLMPTMMTQ